MKKLLIAATMTLAMIGAIALPAAAQGRDWNHQNQGVSRGNNDRRGQYNGEYNGDRNTSRSDRFDGNNRRRTADYDDHSGYNQGNFWQRVFTQRVYVQRDRQYRHHD
jgi:opacity protein-like surface antigen